MLPGFCETVQGVGGRGFVDCRASVAAVAADVQTVHAVSHVIRELREAGMERDLLDELWRRLHDQVVLDRDDVEQLPPVDCPQSI